MNPKYPIYIISKGRWESRLTSKALEKMNVPYLIAIEPQEYEQYAAVIDPKKILVAPFSNLGQGSIPIRNFVWNHSLSIGAERHWVIDDNCRDWCRMNRNQKPQCASGTIFRIMEDFVDRYENVAMSGCQYFMFTPRKVAHPAFTLNTRIYSCILIKNDIPYRWRGRYNEDTDISIRALKDGFCTVLFYAFPVDKMPTLTMKGGNMEVLYKDEDSRLKMAKSLVAQHPDITTIYWRWGRHQHLVDYRQFKKNQLRLKPGLVIPDRVNNYGMEIKIFDEPVPDPNGPKKKPKKRTQQPTVTVVNSPLEPSVVDNLTELPSLAQYPEFGFDTETTTEPLLFDRKIVGLSYYLPDGKKAYVPIRHPGGGNFPEENVKRWVEGEFRNKRLIGANSKYEVHMTRNWGISLEDQGCTPADVFHQAALLNEKRFQLNMNLITKEEFPDYKKIEADHENIYRMPIAQAAPIAVEDAELAYRLDKAYAPRITLEGLDTVLNLENDLVYATCEMERNGAYLDITKLLKWQVEISEEITSRITRVSTEAGFEVEAGSWKSLQRLFDQLKLKYPRTEASETHPDGCPSFPEEFLEKVSHPLVKYILEIRQMASYKSKFIDAYLGRVMPDGRLFYSLHQLRGDEGGTITGRYSSSQSRDGIGVNIQQVAKKEKQPALLQRWNIRELFLPPEGRTWFSADAAQIELRFLVHYAAVNGWTRLADEYRKDPWKDFHMLMVLWTGLIREFAKNVTFAKQYGAGPSKIAYMCRVSETKGKQIANQYDRQFPEAGRLLAMASQQAEKIGYVRTILGRRRRFAPGDRLYSAWNAVVQGSAADINKLKVLMLHRNRKQLDIVNRFTVHDEVDGDCASPKSIRRIQELLNEQSVELMAPILWDCEHGKNWGELTKEI